jgi:hypothetical protein
MPLATVNLVNGQASSALSAGDHFVWLNPTSNVVTVSNCGGFCTQSSYTVPVRTATGPGETPAQLSTNPTSGWNFTENPSSTWNPGGTNPGVPHIQNPSKVADVA